MQTAAAVIPARLGSTRLPNKALIAFNNRPMVLHVCDRAREAEGIGRIIVATDSEEIAQVVREGGYEAELVTEDCPSGTDRVARVVAKIDEKVIVNLQGDEPFMEPQAIAMAAQLVLSGKTRMGTCVTDFHSVAEFRDPAQVKCVYDDNGVALYFSRAAIPYLRNEGLTGASKEENLLRAANVGRHLGLYSYDREFLLKFVSLKPSFLETTESLEQLRVLQYGEPVHVARVASEAFGINTPEELERAKQFAKEHY